MKTIALHNLGCKVNSYEIDVMQQMLQKHGYEIVQFEQKADVYVINTCSVTNMADHKSRQMLHRAKKRNPNAIVVAVGCYVQADAFHVAQDEAVDLLIGNNRKNEIAEILERFSKKEYEPKEQTDEENERFLRKTLGNTTVVDIKKADFEDACMSHTAEHTRAYIKIQDGCNRFCSYCIIPYTRGRVRSRSPESVLEEIRQLAAQGYQEFVLTGIHLSSYGIDFEKHNESNALLEIIGEINAIEGVARIRLGSLEPMIITEAFVKRLTACKKVCPHFHLSLQSGCDETLKRMNRRYSAGEYFERVKILRKFYPLAAITTDVIVGFPGETQEEFACTKAFLEKIGFYEMHIFKYSRRRGTKADGMEGQISEETKNERSNELLQLTEAQSKEFRTRFIGQKVSVLLEEIKPEAGKDYWVGYTPEYVKVAVASSENLQNQLVEVTPQGSLSSDLLY